MTKDSAVVVSTGKEDIRKLVDSAEDAKRAFGESGRPFVLVIEALIGGGKSVCCNMLKRDHPDMESLTEVGFNIFLPRMKRDPKRWAPIFQTFMMHSVATNCRIGDCNLLHGRSTCVERSVLGNIVFTVCAFANGLYPHKEFEVFAECSGVVLRQLSDEYRRDQVTVYLDSAPERCLRNIRKRDREGEEWIDVEYLQGVQTAYVALLLYFVLGRRGVNLLTLPYDDFGATEGPLSPKSGKTDNTALYAHVAAFRSLPEVPILPTEPLRDTLESEKSHGSVFSHIFETVSVMTAGAQRGVLKRFSLDQRIENGHIDLTDIASEVDEAMAAGRPTRFPCSPVAFNEAEIDAAKV